MGQLQIAHHGRQTREAEVIAPLGLVEILPGRQHQFGGEQMQAQPQSLFLLCRLLLAKQIALQHIARKQRCKETQAKVLHDLGFRG
jgi:hypothetical protein